MLSSVLSSILAAELQQAAQIPLQALAGQQAAQEQLQPRPVRSPAHREISSPTDSDHGEECPEDIEFSEDGGLMPDTPSFTGLFRPSLFKSLLHKARLKTNFSTTGQVSSGSQAATGPHEVLFKVAKQEQDFIACPVIFGCCSGALRSAWVSYYA